MTTKLPEYVTEEEFAKIMKVTKQKHHKVAYFLGFCSGLRIQEVLNLQPEDIKFNEHKIEIRQGKGSKDRVAPLHPAFKQEFIKQLPIKCKKRALQSAFTATYKRAGINKKLHFHCVDSNTQILTIDGWKNYNEIKKGDFVYNYNLIKNCIEMDILKEINVYENYKGEVYHIKNKYIDSIITPQHKIPCRVSIKKGNKDIWKDFGLYPIEEVFDTKAKRQIKYYLSAIKTNQLTIPSLDTIGIAKAGILGWILSDGNISDYSITISQSISANPKKCEIISKLLQDSGLKYSIKIQNIRINSFNKKPYQMVNYRIFNENIDWIFDYVNKDRTPILEKILKLPRDELQAILDNMMLGDGTARNEYCGQNKARIELIRILCCFLGKRTLLGTKQQRGKIYSRCYITNYDWCNIHNVTTKKLFFGKVWCPTTNNGTFIAKRNNTIFITSNSLRHGFAVTMMNKGMPLNQIQLFLGHANIATTSIYTKINPTDALKSYEEMWK